jgi:hypothetical protein
MLAIWQRCRRQQSCHTAQITLSARLLPRAARLQATASQKSTSSTSSLSQVLRTLTGIHHGAEGSASITRRSERSQQAVVADHNLSARQQHRALLSLLIVQRQHVHPAQTLLGSRAGAGVQGTIQANGGRKRYVRFGSAKFAAGVLPEDQRSTLLLQVIVTCGLSPLTCIRCKWSLPIQHDPASSEQGLAGTADDSFCAPCAGEGFPAGCGGVGPGAEW